MTALWLVLAALPAQGQEAPAPLATPGVTAIPGVAPSRFSLGEPSPTPLPPPPLVQTTPVPSPTPRAPPPPGTRRPEPSPQPSASPAAPAPSTPAPVAQASPAPVATAERAPLPPPAAERTEAATDWRWAGVAGGLLLALAGGWWWWRRRPGVEDSDGEVPAPLAVPAPPPPPPPAPPRPAPEPIQPLRVDQAAPFSVALDELRIAYAAQDMVIECAVLLGNLQPLAAEAVRLSIVPISASPEQDRQIAGFHAAAMLEPAVPAFDLAPGQSPRLPLRLRMPRAAVHVVDLGGRPIFVPLLLVDLRWRAGLSVRRFGADFVLGRPGQGDKLGPLRLDRPAPAAPLAATRYTPRS